jgi:hypothetical protein
MRFETLAFALWPVFDCPVCGVGYFKDSSSIPDSAFSAHLHRVFHCVIPESQLSGVLARR